MSAPKFTPGPWRRAHTHNDPLTARSLAYIESSYRRAPLEIATVFCCYTDSQQAANADLIAAAPDLYEALAAVVDFWAGGDCPPDLMAKIDAALAKAVQP